jgi:hypothetical protein
MFLAHKEGQNMLTERERAVWEATKAQWTKERDRCREALQVAEATLEAIERIASVSLSVAQIAEISRSVNPRHNGVTAAVKRYIDEVAEEDSKINPGEVVHWMRTHGVEGSYPKLMNQMYGILKKLTTRPRTNLGYDKGFGYYKIRREDGGKAALRMPSQHSERNGTV